MRYPIEIVDAPTAREPSGLAMSSRNQYLDAEQRTRAAFIHETLRRMQAEVRAGALALATIEANAEAGLREHGLTPDYAVVRRADDLGLPAIGQSRALIALIAARLGSTRLIDNLLLDE